MSPEEEEGGSKAREGDRNRQPEDKIGGEEASYGGGESAMWNNQKAKEEGEGKKGEERRPKVVAVLLVGTLQRTPR